MVTVLASRAGVPLYRNARWELLRAAVGFTLAVLSGALSCVLFGSPTMVGVGTVGWNRVVGIPISHNATWLAVCFCAVASRLFGFLGLLLTCGRAYILLTLCMFILAMRMMLNLISHENFVMHVCTVLKDLATLK